MSSIEYAIGFDPGGKNAFGWAVLQRSGEAIALSGSGTVTELAEALQSSGSLCERAPTGVAIDAPLFWVLDKDREADRFVRGIVRAQGGKTGTVGHVNSLWGACLVQGVQAARLAKARWPDTSVSEAHPKALLLASRSARDFAVAIGPHLGSEHERDAALAAFAVLNGLAFSDSWVDLAELDAEAFFPGGCPVAYWFPREAT